MRTFNTAGPCRADWHYMLPPEPRLADFDEIVQARAYFVVHAPRQTGKTTTLMALARRLTAAGQHASLHFSCEGASPFPDDISLAEHAIWSAVEREARRQLPEGLRPPPKAEGAAGQLLADQLTRWAEACPKPLVLVFDEIDALTGPSLIAVLRQLRQGYPSRPEAFPASVVLCGMRDVRDYKAASGGDPSRLATSSPFNVKIESMRIDDFTEEQLRSLYAQHTAETGQPFTEGAMARAFDMTRGQPWLVNAVAREVVAKMNVPAPVPISEEHIEEAKERLILARATHLDSLVARLEEDPVRAVVEVVMAGKTIVADSYHDSVSYVRDLGLCAPDNPVRIANPIYREVIVRVLSAHVEGSMTVEPKSFVRPEGTLDVQKILDEFVMFWKQHGDILAQRNSYHEVAPQLILMAYFQRIVNAGGYIDREYGVGRGRIDMCVRWPYRAADGTRRWQLEAVEIKVWSERRKDPLAEGLAQLEGYLDRLSLQRGILAIFDRRPDAAPIEERTRFEEQKTPKGHPVTVLRG